MTANPALTREMNARPRRLLAGLRCGLRCIAICLGLAHAVSFAADARGGRSITQGKGKTQTATLLPCTGQNARMSPVGTIKSTDGKTWTVPAETAFLKGPKASDLYNACNNFTPAGLEAVDTSAVPVVEVDPDGEVITGYLFADNYFELYVNGKLVAVDPVPFTPFNSSIVRFKAKRPLTYAVMLVDWEENLAVGTEQGPNGSSHHPGDGGFIASFSDGTVTDASWKAQSFYIAPLTDPRDVVERGNVHDASKLGRTYPAGDMEAPCANQCYAIHYPLPRRWELPKFNDKNWPAAVEFTEQEVGVNNLSAFTSFREAFSGAHFIWSTNLIYDNLVLMRKVTR